jgi:hypothetical protein
VRRVVPLALAASIVLAACEPGEEAPTPAPAVTSSTPPSSGTTTPTTIGPDPLVTWSPQPKAVGERGEGWLRETLLVTAPGGVLLHVTPVSSSLTLEYVDATRSLGVWIEIENAGDVDWSGVFGADATLSDDVGNIFVPVASPQARDLHPDPARYGASNRNLMKPLTLAAGERTQGALVFRPTLGNRAATLAVSLGDDRTASWIVNIGQL